ncbi:MAG: zinc ribbon domain-containing protein [Methanobrevibacter thaueri]|jgi:hypothetical protein|uniref:Zinc ribbon domain-containing protein n=1 Tax=Methanobrevibacter thaueri TaxID=190975 RepID=A0A8T3VF82_9EURY|nr:zinc ribbon domain-containing protein [Methanobrevibacter thaueri]MBE6501268.1 zinc ribbon domain-containing protein [Methanobrevibacter thaueri]
MVQYCRKCGKELADDSEFCDGCGFKLNENPNAKQVVKHSEDNKNEFVTKLPLILAVVGIVVSIAEGLGTPMLMGWDNILTAMAIGIVGGIIGIVLMEKLDEPLIAAVEFIATGALVFMFIGRFGEISTILFIIAAILTLYFKGYYAHNKKLWLIPILTVVLIFVMIIAGGAFYQMNAVNSIEVGNITENIGDGGYGYFNGSVTGDIFVGTNFDYLEVTVNYYDNQDKIIYSGIAWNDLNPESGKTYHFDGMYFDQKQPAKAEVKVVDSAKSTTPLYTENITISPVSGV